MSTQVTLTISDELYRRAGRLARTRGQNMNDLLLELLEQATLADDALTYEPDEAVGREVSAYIAMHPLLWENYAGEHVAIYGEELVDHDGDGVALSRRIYARYPSDFVLIRQVEAESERVLHFRSPRFAESVG